MISQDRRITYLTGTRADYGLMKPILQALNAHHDVQLDLVVTGTHLSPLFDSTVEIIREDGFSIRAEIQLDLEGGDGASMTRSFGQLMLGLESTIDRHTTDLLLVIGDRGEMLAGALAAIHENIHVAHIHGGERSGTVDESLRHAISKLAHFHLPATSQGRNRLVRLGEDPDHIHVIGAPGLVGIRALAEAVDYHAICRKHGLNPGRKTALVVFHPVVQSADGMEAQTEVLVEAVRESGVQALWLLPNSDAGRTGIASVLDRAAEEEWLHLATNLPRSDFLSVMAHCDVMVGNSSAGIIEAASFDTPVINIGDRQQDRERSCNTIDCTLDRTAILTALRSALKSQHSLVQNVYERTDTVRRAVDVLAGCKLDRAILNKRITY